MVSTDSLVLTAVNIGAPLIAAATSIGAAFLSLNSAGHITELPNYEDDEDLQNIHSFAVWGAILSFIAAAMALIVLIIYTIDRFGNVFNSAIIRRIIMGGTILTAGAAMVFSILVVDRLPKNENFTMADDIDPRSNSIVSIILSAITLLVVISGLAADFLIGRPGVEPVDIDIVEEAGPEDIDINALINQSPEEVNINVPSTLRRRPSREGTDVGIFYDLPSGGFNTSSGRPGFVFR
jgi:hypothetical protein